MVSHGKKLAAKPRVAEEIMEGMRELQKMMKEGKRPEEIFTVRMIDIPEPRTYSSKDIRALRDVLGVSQAVFAHLLGVSVVLVKSWERGVRVPNVLARRLMDTIRSNPSQWLLTIRTAAQVQESKGLH